MRRGAVGPVMVATAAEVECCDLWVPVLLIGEGAVGPVMVVTSLGLGLSSGSLAGGRQWLVGALNVKRTVGPRGSSGGGPVGQVMVATAVGLGLECCVMRGERGMAHNAEGAVGPRG